MQKQLGWFFPDGETHLPDWMRKVNQKRDGVLQYQLAKYHAALKFVRSRRVAVDVGAHIGQWSCNMAADFATVHAFEPVPTYAKCWRANMEGHGNYGRLLVESEPENGWKRYEAGDISRSATLYQIALGDRQDVVALRCGTPGSHGDTFIAPREQANMATDVPMLTLDSLHIGTVDFMKIDCEGYELFVLKGGESTIRREQPCIVVEQKPGKGNSFGLGETDAVDLLTSWGAKVRQVMAGDYILSWDAA